MYLGIPRQSKGVHYSFYYGPLQYYFAFVCLVDCILWIIVFNKDSRIEKKYKTEKERERERFIQNKTQEVNTLRVKLLYLNNNNIKLNIYVVKCKAFQTEHVEHLSF